MDSTLIRSLWRPRATNRDAAVAMWDSMADDFNDHEVPSFEDDHLLGIFERHDMLSSDADVLDVACGAGTYSLAIADRVNSTTGIDISSAMTAHARARAEALSRRNCCFITGDWRDVDLDSQGMAQRFDLVFAHMTPAIDGPDTFEKLARASRGWCVLSKPTRRVDPIARNLDAILDIEKHPADGGADVAYGFSLLWAQGLRPQLEYRDTVWDNRRPVAKVREFYLNRIRTHHELDDAAIALVDEYLCSIADRKGLIAHQTDVTITTMFWHV
jgi:SAM-dependent methyltransferase